MPTDLYFVIAALLAVIPVSGAVRIAIYLLQINTDPDQEQMYRKRAKNVLWFIIIATCAESMMWLAYAYLA